MSFLRMQESPNFLFIKRFRDKPGMTNRSNFGLFIQPHLGGFLPYHFSLIPNNFESPFVENAFKHINR